MSISAFFNSKIFIPLTCMLLSACSIFAGSNFKLEDKTNRKSDENIHSLIDVYELNLSLINQLKIRKPHIISKQNKYLEQKINDYKYTIGPGDVLNITVWDHPELTIPAGSFRSSTEAGNWVHSNGSIFYPYIGRVKVAGYTVEQIRGILATKLSKFIESPQVDVNVAAFRSQKVFITGEVNEPGPQAITNIPLTLLDAINKSGGINLTADWTKITLTRNGIKEEISLQAIVQKGDLTQNRLLLNGDIIHVPLNSNQKVFVMGEVNDPKTIMIERTGMSLTEALSSAGGIDQLNADATGVFVIRNLMNQDPDCKIEQQYIQEYTNSERAIADVYQLNMTNATALVLGTEFALEPYDIVYVTAAPITRWNRIVAQLLPTISGFNSLLEGPVRIRNL